MASINIAQFRDVLPSVCCRDTSLDADGWSADNPLQGHCAVVSLVAQNLFGGQLLRASLENTVFASMRSHYWNLLPENREEDFTRAQFGTNFPAGLEGKIKERSYVLSYPATVERYKLWALKLAKKIQPNDTVDDKIYEACFYSALDSQCKKLRFGCVAVRNGEIVSRGANATIGPLAYICEPSCVRMSIQSRTDAMIGACGHAEEFVLWDLAKKNVPLNDCDVYVAGIFPNGLPIPEDNTEYSCLRCAVQMFNAGVNSVSGPMNGRWIQLPTARALETAVAYATKQKMA